MCYPWDWIIAHPSECKNNSSALPSPSGKNKTKQKHITRSFKKCTVSAVGSCSQSSPQHWLLVHLQEDNWYKLGNMEPKKMRPHAVPILLRTIFIMEYSRLGSHHVSATLQTTSSCSTKDWYYCLSTAQFCWDLLQNHQGSSAVAENLPGVNIHLMWATNYIILHNYITLSVIAGTGVNGACKMVILIQAIAGVKYLFFCF